MRVHRFSNGCSSWDQHDSLSLNCKRLRPLAPKFSGPSSPPSSSSGITSATFDLKSFIKPHNDFPVDHKGDPPQVETHPGGTRWNPTQEQIGILEMLYRGGMRTPNAQQIEHITSQLGKYGKIEGKNVFYWFQNHKARERQKQKRNSLSCQSSFKTRTSLSLDLSRESTVEKELCEEIANKRTCKSWGFENLEIESRKNNGTEANICIHDVTLELFPLHPEGR